MDEAGEGGFVFGQGSAVIGLGIGAGPHGDSGRRDGQGADVLLEDVVAFLCPAPVDLVAVRTFADIGLGTCGFDLDGIVYVDAGVVGFLLPQRAAVIIGDPGVDGDPDVGTVPHQVASGFRVDLQAVLFHGRPFLRLRKILFQLLIPLLQRFDALCEEDRIPGGIDTGLCHEVGVVPVQAQDLVGDLRFRDFFYFKFDRLQGAFFAVFVVQVYGQLFAGAQLDFARLLGEGVRTVHPDAAADAVQDLGIRIREGTRGGAFGGSACGGTGAAACGAVLIRTARPSGGTAALVRAVRPAACRTREDRVRDGGGSALDDVGSIAPGGLAFLVARIEVDRSLLAGKGRPVINFGVARGPGGEGRGIHGQLAGFRFDIREMGGDVLSRGVEDHIAPDRVGAGAGVRAAAVRIDPDGKAFREAGDQYVGGTGQGRAVVKLARALCHEPDLAVPFPVTVFGIRLGRLHAAGIVHTFFQLRILFQLIPDKAGRIRLGKVHHDRRCIHKLVDVVVVEGGHLPRLQRKCMGDAVVICICELGLSFQKCDDRRCPRCSVRSRGGTLNSAARRAVVIPLCLTGRPFYGNIRRRLIDIDDGPADADRHRRGPDLEGLAVGELVLYIHEKAALREGQRHPASLLDEFHAGLFVQRHDPVFLQPDGRPAGFAGAQRLAAVEAGIFHDKTRIARGILDLHGALILKKAHRRGGICFRKSRAGEGSGETEQKNKFQSRK